MKKSYLLFSLMLLLSISSCTKTRKTNESTLSDTVSLAEQLAEFEESKSVKTTKRIIQRNQKKLHKAQLALYSQAQAQRALGLLYLNQQFYEAALEQFQLALRLTPANALLHYYAGVSSGWMSNLESDTIKRQEFVELALFHLNKSSELNSSHADTALALATLYTEIEDLNKARFQLKRYQSLDPNSMDAKLIEASILVKEENYTVARNIYQQILQESKSTFLRDQASRGLEAIKP